MNSTSGRCGSADTSARSADASSVDCAPTPSPARNAATSALRLSLLKVTCHARSAAFSVSIAARRVMLEDDPIA